MCVGVCAYIYFVVTQNFVLFLSFEYVFHPGTIQPARLCGLRKVYKANVAIWLIMLRLPTHYETDILVHLRTAAKYVSRDLKRITAKSHQLPDFKLSNSVYYD